MIKSPVLIIGCARSGTTLLYSLLATHPELWSIGYESKLIIEHFHHPRMKDWVSGELSAADLTSESREFMTREFERRAAPGAFWQRVMTLRNWLNRSERWRTIKKQDARQASSSLDQPVRAQRGLQMIQSLVVSYRRVEGSFSSVENRPIRLLEKTPENCLRLPFLRALWPDTRVVFLVRDGRANVSSLINGWQEPRLFPGYDVPEPVKSPGQTRGRWAFTLIPGWRNLVDRPLAEISARQWLVCNQAVLDYRSQQSALPILQVRYENLVRQPESVLGHITDFLDLAPLPDVHKLPQVNTLSAPDAEKWRRHEAELAAVWPLMQPMMRELGYPEDLPV